MSPSWGLWGGGSCCFRLHTQQMLQIRNGIGNKMIITSHMSGRGDRIGPVHVSIHPPVLPRILMLIYHGKRTQTEDYGTQEVLQCSGIFISAVTSLKVTVLNSLLVLLKNFIRKLQM